MRLSRHRDAGFTIIELLIATAVFSTILVIVAAGIIQFTKQYYKAQIYNNTQNVTRNAINQVAQAIQFGGGADPSSIGGTLDGAGGWCVNNHEYFYILGRQLNGSNSQDTTQHALISTDNTCDGTSVDVTSTLPNSLNNPQELLGKNMRLVKFNITPSNGLTTVSMRVVYGDYDLLCWTGGDNVCHPITSASDAADLQKDTLRCAGGRGSEYCAVADYSVTTTKRLQ